MKNLIIIGVGGFAREVYWLALDAVGYGKDFVVKGFLDGDTRLSEDAYQKLPMFVIGNIGTYEPEENDVFVIGIGNGKVREKIANRMNEKGARWINLIHRFAGITPSARLGVGNIVCWNCGISANAIIGNHIVVNAFSTIAHDVEIGDYTSIMSYVNITGEVKVGKRTYWGSGTRVVPGTRIGDDAVIGIGSVVVKNVKQGTTVFGNPAVKLG